MSTLATVFGYGLLSARAAASIAGRFYYATDTSIMYRDNGSTWDALAVGAGSVATDTLWDAAGDLAQGTGADTAAKLSAGTAGQFLMAGGASTALAWKSRELDYVQITAGVACTATTEATANTIITGSAVSYDGSTAVMVEAWFPYIATPASLGVTVSAWLYDGASSIGRLFVAIDPAAGAMYNGGVLMSRRLTPSNASHTYSVRGSTSSGSASFVAGAGGNGNDMPAWMRITRAV